MPDPTTIPMSWTSLWWARHKPTGEEYRIKQVIDRGERFHPDGRNAVIRQLYRTPAGHIVAWVEFRDGFLTTLGLRVGSKPEAWDWDEDAKYERGETRCAFCDRQVVVHLWNNRKRDKCHCGATHFFRRVRQGGKVVAESEGWRKNGKEIERC